jgi:TolB-like protein
MGLLSELKRRNVFRMAVLYVVAAWLIAQVAEVVLSLAALPDWIGQVVLMVLALGFPIALVFSWFYELTPEGLTLEKDVRPNESITHITGRRMDFVVIALLASAVILFAWHTWWSPIRTDTLTAPNEVIKSVAVLPLQNLSSDPAQEYFVEGMQDALITRLSRITELRVISRTSTMRYESTDKSMPEIARELNVDALIEGTVFREEGRIRITAKLIRGAEDEHVWANSYDRDLNQVLALISEISLAIADEIEAAVKPQLAGGRAQRSPFDFEVHELVLKGDHLFNRLQFNESLRHYQQAVDLDADCAPAHAGIAAVYMAKSFFHQAPSSEFIPKAREAALKAISLDSNSANGYATLGSIQLYFDWDWDSARSSLLKALELDPNKIGVRHAYADYLMVMGDLEESLKQVEIGRLYDPFSPVARLVLDGHRIFARQYDEVIEEARSDIAKDPDAAKGLTFYREALWYTGKYQEALDEYRRTWGRNEALLRAINSGFSESGYSGAIRSLADALVERDPEFKDKVALAILFARAGEPKLALEMLESAYQDREPQILHINANPAFDEIRTNPAFQDLLDRIGFPDTAATL